MGVPRFETKLFASVTPTPDYKMTAKKYTQERFDNFF